MKHAFLEGEKIYLRGLEMIDLEGNYINWLNDAEVCRYNSHHVFPYYRENAEAYIKSIANSRMALVLAIVLKENDRHIGNISLQNINHINRSAEFAILVGEKDCWGKGYSKEAASMIIGHGFAELDLNRIYCGTNANNKAMQKLAEGLGMKKEGIRRSAMFKSGGFVDVVEYGLLRDEFFKNKE